MHNKTLLFLSLMFTLFGLSLQAQGLQRCNNGVGASTQCTASCINCDLNGITDFNSVPFPPGAPNTTCNGNLTLDNPRWYGFIAGSNILTLAVTPIQCINANGLEFALAENCNVISCFPGPNNLVAGQYILSFVNLVPGRPYQFLIDGFNGGICQYTISVLGGSAQGPPVGPIDPIVGLTQVCPNATVEYTIPPVANALTYTWSAPAGSSINGGGNVVILSALTGNNNTVQVTFGNAGGNVCVSASNACGTPTTACLPVSNTPLAATQLPDLLVCYNETPYEWQEEPFTILAAPGTYNLTSSPYISYLGCDSLVKQKITLLPLNQVNLPVKYICKDECFVINGLEYCETGQFQEYLIADNGCDSIVNFSLIKIESNAVAAQPDTITCAVTSVPLSGAGSTSGNTVSYRWLNPAGQVISNAITATATAPGEYLFIVTNIRGGNACMDTAIVVVPGDLTPPQVDAGPNKVLTCVVTEVELEGTGSMGPLYSYFWKAQLGGNIVSGVNTLNPIVNATGTYTLRVTNNYNGCTAISNASVTAQLAPPVITTTGGTFTCTQPNITLQVATNAPNPGFLWSGPNNFTSTLQNPVVNQPGTYTVLVTNGNTGCTATATAVVNAGNDTPDVSATGGDITCIQNAVTLAATSGVAGVTYAWTGPNNFNSTQQNPTVSATGNYQVVVTAPNGCSNTAVAAVVLNTTPPGTTLAASGSLNCNNDAVNVLATSNGNPALLTHAWTLPGGATQNTGAVAFLPATVAGVYSVLVNNTATGCTSTASFTVVEFDDVTASIGTTTDTKCAGSADGSLQAVPAGGNGVYTYNWSNGGNTAINTGLISGAYVVTVTDGEGCSTTASGTVGSPAALVATGSATAQTANGTTDGTATVDQTGGTPGYTYLWSNAATTQNISGLLPGSYTVTVTDANGCTAIATVNVNQYNCLLQTSLQVINVSCFGANDGAALLSFEGGTSPFDVTWSTGVGTNDVSDLAPGQYSVSVVDAANCPQVQSFTITEPVVLAVNGAGSITTGVGSNDGTATANPTGGTGAYSYAWSNNETTAAISNLAPGLYTVTVTDENSCSAVQTIEVVVGNCNLSTDLQITQPTCSNSTDGAVTLILTGGAGGFSYNWSSGSTTETESGLAAGTQIVTVTDVNGCSIQVPVTLVAPDALIITVDSTFSTDCPANPEGAAYISVAGGTGDLSVTWSNNQSGLSLTGLTAGTYTATLTDDNGCTTTQAVVIGSNDTEAPAITALPVEVPIGTNGTVVLTEQNVQADITDNCGVTSVVFQPASFECTQLGEHQVTIVATDGSGLTASATVTVTIVDDEAPALICSPSLVLCFEDNPVSYQAPTATDNCLINGIVFNITGGLPIGATFPVGTTLTTYSAVDAQGNEGTCSFEVTILSPLTLEIDTIINDFNFQTVGAIFVNVTGSLPPYNYSWVSEGVEISTSQNLTGVPAGDYILQVTDDNGCNITSQILTISNTSDTKTPALLDGIRVFPNPTPGNLSVLLPDALVASDVYLQVFDQTGRRVLDQHASNDKVIDVAMFNLADGLYSLVIRAGEQQVVHKIVLTK